MAVLEERLDIDKAFKAVLSEKGLITMLKGYITLYGRLFSEQNIFLLYFQLPDLKKRARRKRLIWLAGVLNNIRLRP